MRLMTTAFADGQRIPGDFAFCVADAGMHVKLSANLNPDFAWSDLPPETKSLVMICHDPDVPSRGDDVNREGRSVSASLPRVDFFHWVLVDLPPNTLPISRGEFSKGITPRGKAGPAAARGARQGLNDYTGWFAADNLPQPLAGAERWGPHVFAALRGEHFARRQGVTQHGGIERRGHDDDF